MISGCINAGRLKSRNPLGIILLRHQITGDATQHGMAILKVAHCESLASKEISLSSKSIFITANFWFSPKVPEIVQRKATVYAAIESVEDLPNW